jgi:hypothetical protein
MWNETGRTGERSNPLPEKTKRHREVFPTDEIPHLWAHKTQESARNQQGNLFFENGIIFSYGHHFPIAKHVTSPNGKQTAILVTTRGHSVTTAKHISSVRQSISRDALRFDVPDVLVGLNDHGPNLRAYIRESVQALTKAAKSRKYGTQLLSEAFGYRESARAYAKFFRQPVPRFPFLPTAKTLDGLKERIKIREAKAAIKDAVAQKRREAEYAERRRIQSLEQAEKLELWLSGSPAVDTWMINGCDTALRITGDEVQTSRGARVPIAHAIAALAVVRRVMARNEEFVTNGHTIHVGHYTLDKITTDGTIYAGCHVIKFEAIQRIAPLLDVISPAEVTP